MTPTDPLPNLFADCITGIHRLGEDGPFLRFKAEPTQDGREIVVHTTPYDFGQIGDRSKRIVLHVSTPMPPADEPECPQGVGTMDEPESAK